MTTPQLVKLHWPIFELAPMAKLAPYGRFPREFAAEYDVIEIPSVWSFNRAVRLFWGGG